MHALVIVYDHEIYLTFHATRQEAESALMDDIRETYGESDDLPESYDPLELSDFIGNIGDSYNWTIEECRIAGTFDHVGPESLRQLLQTGQASPAQWADAINLSAAALDDDKEDESIPGDVLAAREGAFYDAFSAWNAMDTQTALTHLRTMWSR